MPRRTNASTPYGPESASVNYRERPERYRVGRGEQGVLIVEPYKSELLPLWRFRTPEIARESSARLYDKFLAYKEADDFVGMDMARKFLQMGWTRARRYANHRSGRKWSATGDQELPDEIDPVKAESARIFFEMYTRARTDADYLRMKDEHRRRYESSSAE